jgi:RNA polymerase sigma-70 factor (ECF subfamily)
MGSLVSKVMSGRGEIGVASGEAALGASSGLLAQQAATAAAGTAGAQETGLVAECRQGDPDAFARLVALHEHMVFNLALRLTGDPEEARDIAQDVFLQVFRMLSRFEGRSSLRTWIYRIVVNQCHNRQRWWKRRRKDRTRPLEELTPADEAQMSARSPEASNPYEEIRRREQGCAVQAALLGVSFEHRAILLLREVEGLSVEQVAESLGLPQGTVKSRLSRAREALRRQLLAVAAPARAATLGERP